MTSPWVRALAVVGGATLLYAVYVALDFFALHFIKPLRPLNSYKRKGPDPTYALITGASAGIGLGIAQELVKQGFGVILLGHLAYELAQARQALQKATPRASVRILVMDVRTATPTDMAVAVKSFDELHVSILVNNVGGCPIELPPMREMATYSCADVDAVINMNARFMARLTTLMLPILSRRPANPGERSLIINSSSAAHCGVPWLTMYGATKAFNLAFSRGLARELEASFASSHVDCLAIAPGDVLSQGNSRGVARGAPTWDDYGRCVVQTVDGAVQRKMRDVSPYWVHDIENRILPWLDEGTRTTEISKAIAKKKNAWDAYLSKAR
ncbi:Very-long-chain 3-oxoacyl-CoA reductase [Tolypocladium ophioglossoides CBS 100239]|uniref:Very-long-chain 3-oxoacyl-CoA reductase n=1 Tax=Tolypocladium ophioglossoides (strain CBS 100239) TaxID=1163406 RepID=A0A0L0N6E9_TOLOC|nr:Very-long-chain 3-oxoacyl-CoA reductase [Tolypocladium ophioglossoides CBS 100239]